MTADGSDLGRSMRGLAWRVNVAAAIRSVVDWGSGSLATAGLVMLIARAGFGASVQQSMWVLLVFPLGVAGGLVAWLIRRVDVDEVWALADARIGAGGVLMSGAETKRAAIADAVDALQVRCRAQGAGLVVLVGAVMVTGALVLPARGRLAGGGPLQIAEQVEDVGAKIDILKEVELISPDEADRLEETLEELSRRASGSAPGSALEALDWAEARVERGAAAAVETLESRHAESAVLEELARSVASQEGDGAAALAAAAGAAMESLLQESALSPEDAAALAELASALAASTGLTEAERRELLDAAKATAATCKANATKSFEKMIASRLAGAQALARAKAISEAAAARLRLALAKGECSGDALGMCLALAGCPGRGGVSRGPGPAVLTWRDQDDQTGLAYQPGQIESESVNPEDSVVIASMQRPPEPGEDGEASSSGGVIDPSHASPASAAGAITLPRHRDAVRRYFERGKAKEGGR